MSAVPQSSPANTSGTIAEAVAEFAANFRHEQIPAPVRRQACHILLDGIGIAFASGQFEFAQRAYGALVGQEPGAGSTVIGMAGQLGLRDAVMLNSMLVHGLDFDDTYFAGGLHPTATCLPSALGVGEARQASGRDVLTAYVLGMEVTTRLAGIAQGFLNQCGMHPSSMLGGFAGAIVSGWLQGLNAEQLTNAQGIALGMAAGTLESLVDGSWTKRIQPGWAAASGITAARLARQGFVGSRAAYEGKFGLFPAHMGARVSECDFSAGTRALGEQWLLMEVALKPAPACHAAQAVIQAATAIARETRLVPENIESVTAVVPNNYVTLVCEPIERKRKPDSAYGAQFSIPFTAASSLIHGRFGLAQIQDSALRNPRTLELAAKVGYQVDASFTTAQFKTSRPAELIVKMKNGETHVRKISKLKGSVDAPMSHDEIVEKFIDNALTVMSRSRAERLRDMILDIEALPDVRALTGLLHA